MMNWLKYIYAFVVILVLQILCSEFINLWPMLYIAVIPLMVILLPPSVSTYLVMLCGFIIGLLTDALSDGVLGLNAACCTLVGACKNMITKPMLKYDIHSEEFDMESGVFRKGKLILLLFLCYLLFFVPYVLLDGAGASGALFLVIRIVVNIVANVAISYLLTRLWIRRFFL